MGLTYRVVLRRIAEQLLRTDPDNPKQTAVMILAAYLQVSPEYIWQHPFAPFFEGAVEQFWPWFDFLLLRRAQGEPWAYILGETYFMGYRFSVSSAVLIPRADSEVLVEEALAALRSLVNALPAEKIRSGDYHLQVADLCTGSGCLLLALALELKKEAWAKTVQFTFVGSDLDPAALQVARENQLKLYPNGKFYWLQGDLFAASCAMHHLKEEKTSDSLQSGDRLDFAKLAPFALLLSNPPYISLSEYAELEYQVQAFEPRLALTDEADGYQLYKRLLEDAPSYLLDNGYLLVEHGFRQQAGILALSEKSDCWQVVCRRCDYGARARVLVWQLAKFDKGTKDE